MPEPNSPGFPRGFFSREHHLHAALESLFVVETIVVPAPTPGRIDRILGPWMGAPAWKVDPAVLKHAQERLSSGDCVAAWISGLPLSGYLIGLSSGATPVWFDTPFAESMPLADEVLGGFRRWFEAPRAARWTYWEERACALADRVFTSSEMDASRLRKLVPNAEISVAPAWIDIERLRAAGIAAGTTSHDGSIERVAVMLDPTDRHHRQSLSWLALEVLPRLARALGTRTLPRFELFGWPSNDALFKRLSLEQRALHRAESTFGNWSELLSGSIAALFPVQGGATASARFQVEIVEAMARAKPVLATGFALDGLAFQFGHDCLLAEETNAFTSALRTLLAEPARREELGKAAQAAARSRYDWRATLPALKDARERPRKIT